MNFDRSLRPASSLSLVAGATIVACVTTMAVGAGASEGLVAALAALAGATVAAGLISGQRSLVAAGTFMLVGSQAIEYVADESTALVESALIGLLIFLAHELTLEAIDRRDGSTRSPAAWTAWVMQRLVVVALVVAITVGAAALESSAPVRTVLLQAAVALLILGGLGIGTARFVAPTTGAEQS